MGTKSMLRQIMGKEHEFHDHASLSHMENEVSHDTITYPEDTDETVTLTSAGGANTFGAWTELVDNNAVTLSSKFATKHGHISGIFVETASAAAGTIYMFEISFGAAKIIVFRERFIAPGPSIKGAPTQVPYGLGIDLPFGETIYYRSKDSVGGEACTVEIGYMLYS